MELGDYIEIPFDKEKALAISNGKMEGKVMTRKGDDVRVVCIDRKVNKTGNLPIVCLISTPDGECVSLAYENGCYPNNHNEDTSYDLVLKIPYYTTFKDGDVVYAELDLGGGEYYKWIGVLDGTIKSIGNGEYDMTFYATYNKDCCYRSGEMVYQDCTSRADLMRLATEEERSELIKKLMEDDKNKNMAEETLSIFFNIKKEVVFEFKLFDKVLVRYNNCDFWKAGFYGHKNVNGQHICLNGCAYNECIPYNEKTQNLYMTDNEYKK